MPPRNASRPNSRKVGDHLPSIDSTPKAEASTPSRLMTSPQTLKPTGPSEQGETKPTLIGVDAGKAGSDVSVPVPVHPEARLANAQAISASLKAPLGPIRSVFKSSLEEQYEKLPGLIEAEALLLVGASRKEIGVVLDTVATVLNVGVPSEDALATYFSLMEEYPEDLIRIGGREVCRYYKWPSFPKPADFIEQIAPLLEQRKEDITQATDRYRLLDQMVRRGSALPGSQP